MMLSGVLRHLTCGPCAGQRRFLVGLAQTGPARWTGVICSQQAKFCSSSADGHKNKNVTGRREVWFWFWGINSHWPGMARDMLKFPAFCNSIAKSSEIVSDLAGINLLRLVTSMEKKKVDPAMDCVYTNVSIVGMQIGLVDLLRSLDIVPDRICGISLGELSCAYADGCLSRREALLAAYWRAECVKEVERPLCNTAVIGLPWEAVKAFDLPPGVNPIIEVSDRSTMISGRPAEFEKAVEALTSQGVFVRQMGPNMGAHNIDVMAPALPGLKKALQEVIPSPRRASHRWISTVWSEEEWDTRGRLCSPDYVLTNLVEPSRLRQALARIPSGAILMEVSAEGFMKSMSAGGDGGSGGGGGGGPHITVVPLMDPAAKDNRRFFLSSLDKCSPDSVCSSLEAEELLYER